MPNKDLLFVGTGLAMAGLLKLSSASIAAVLIIGTAADQLFGFALVALPWFLDQYLLKREDAHPAT